MKTFALIFFLSATVASAADVPVRDRMTTTEQAQYDAATGAANTVIKARLDERDVLKQQIVSLQAQVAQLQSDLAVERAKSAALQTQLATATAKAITDFKARVAALQ